MRQIARRAGGLGQCAAIAATLLAGASMAFAGGGPSPGGGLCCATKCCPDGEGGMSCATDCQEVTCSTNQVCGMIAGGCDPQPWATAGCVPKPQ